MALNATARITVAAATEYQHYVKVREEQRRRAPSTPSSAQEPGPAESGTDAMGLATAMGEVTETTGADKAAKAAVISPVLSGAMAAIFLLVGYSSRCSTPSRRSPTP